MDCPKCGHAQAGEQECERCGVIFSRLQKKEQGKDLPGDVEREEPLAGAPTKTWSGWGGWLLAMVAGLLAGWYVFAPPQQQSVPEAGQPAVSFQESGPEERGVRQPALPQGTPDQPQIAEGLAGKLAAAFPAGNGLEHARNATVFIKTPWGSGSGFFVTPNGYIITNRHVVEFDAAQLKEFKGKADKLANDLERDRRNREMLHKQLAGIRDPGVRRQVEEELQRRQEAYEKYSAMHKEIVGQLQRIERSSWSSDITVVLIDGSELPVQSLKMSDRADLALLSVDCYNAPFIRGTTDSRRFGQGQKVYSIGSPMGLRHTVTGGIISGYREHKGRKFIQTDAPINPGNSGGPLIDEQGGLIGINTMVLRDAQGIGFAVPFEEVKTEFGQYLGGL
ncbi:MAG: trypsin-like peptidase domain-containing protein [Desulfurivibrionaceae bacterium]|nr:trypsin-like peptidase domain-containing protein [Pseudomonadota bacterium]MDP2003964.1 trypsin-like peptidase domain-containing protein [Desulfurivibrionaceae bacterium]